MSTHEPRRALHSALTTPFDGQTYRNLLYLLLAFPLGLAYFVALTVAGSTTLGFAITLVGPVALVCTLLLVLGLSHVDTRLSEMLLGADLAGPRFPDEDKLLPYLRELVTSRDAWLGVLYLLWRFLLGLGAFVLLTTGLSVSVSLLAAPFGYGEYMVVDYRIGTWQVTTFPRALLAAGGGVVVGYLTLLTGNALARVATAVPGLLFDAETGDAETAADGRPPTSGSGSDATAGN